MVEAFLESCLLKLSSSLFDAVAILYYVPTYQLVRHLFTVGTDVLFLNMLLYITVFQNARSRLVIGFDI